MREMLRWSGSLFCQKRWKIIVALMVKTMRHSVPIAGCQSNATIALQFTGCALVIADWHPELGVGCLIVFIVAATTIFHRFWQKGDPVQRNLARLNLLSNIAILGGLLLLLAELL